MFLQLLENESSSLALNGRHFRIMSAGADAVQCSIYAQGSKIFSGLLKAGVGLDFSDKNDFRHPFDRVELLSKSTQKIEIFASLVKVHDDRLAGNFDINAALSVAQTAPQFADVLAKQSIATATEVLPFNAGRKKALVQVSGAVYVGDVDNGIEVEGAFLWEARAALVLVPKTGTVEVRILEEYD